MSSLIERFRNRRRPLHTITRLPAPRHKGTGRRQVYTLTLCEAVKLRDKLGVKVILRYVLAFEFERQQEGVGCYQCKIAMVNQQAYENELPDTVLRR